MVINLLKNATFDNTTKHLFNCVKLDANLETGYKIQSPLNLDN